MNVKACFSALSRRSIARSASPNASPALLLILVSTIAAVPAPAQQPDIPKAFSDTVIHAAPQRPVVFTNTPSAESAPTEDLGPEPRGIHDDFDNNTPTAWWVYYGQTPAQVSNLVQTLNARIIDIQVDTFTPAYTFTVTMVSNTGAYAKGWWWYYGLTGDQVSANLSANNARLISVKAYDIGNGQIRFAAVMIPNTGVDAKGWWWYAGQSISQISALVSSNNARLVAVDPYTVGSGTLYTAIMISNTGADGTGWWWYVNVTPSFLANAVKTDNARIYYFINDGSGTFDAILESCAGGCSEWWFYDGLNGTQMVDTAVQNGARLVNTSSYPGCGGTCFAGAMINNSNAITTRVGNLLRNGGIGGTEGLYLTQVNGGVLANLEDNVPFEPASTMKVLPNLYAMTQSQAGKVKLTTPITHYTNGAESCPNPPVVSGTEPLEIALREMMWHSDNARTREVTDYFTDAKINAYAKSIGMTNTAINEYIGCAGPVYDTLTLDDASKLYTGVANQTLLNAPNRGIFYSNMAGRAQYESEGYDWTGLWSTDIPNIINQVAPAGTTAAQKTAYQNEMNLAYKAGNYVLCTNNSCSDVVEDIAIAGWFQLPICTATATTYNEYTFGIFFSNEPYNGWSSGITTPTDANFTTAKGELLREQIQAGMASCQGKSFEVMTYTPGDLVFAATTVGTTTASKTITIANKQATAVTGFGISIFGDFEYSSNCTSTMAAGASCNINVKFSPSATGERTGAVLVSDSGTGQPQTIQLTGTGQ